MKFTKVRVPSILIFVFKF